MQENFLTYRNYLGMKIGLVTTGLLIASYVYYSQQMTPHGGTLMGFVYGALGLLAIMFLMYYSRRKRHYGRKQWPLQAWLSFHCYVGIMSLVLIPLHAGFKFRVDIHKLPYVLLAIVVVSGIVGAYLFVRVPREFGKFGAELVYAGDGTVDDDLHRIRQQMRVLAQDKSDGFAQICQAELQRGATVLSPWRQLFHHPAQQATLSSYIDGFQSSLDTILEAEQEDFRRLAELATQKWQLECRLASQMRLQNLLDVWLYFHLPVSVAMTVAVVIHIGVVFFHGYRIF